MLALCCGRESYISWCVDRLFDLDYFGSARFHNCLLDVACFYIFLQFILQRIEMRFKEIGAQHKSCVENDNRLKNKFDKLRYEKVSLFW